MPTQEVSRNAPPPPGAAARCTNLARFDLVSIRLAVYCAEFGSLSAAARRANMSLSRASHRLTALEDSFGTRLFERTPHGLRVTRAGTVLVAHGKELLSTVNRLGDHLFHVGSDAANEGANAGSRGIEKVGSADLP